MYRMIRSDIYINDDGVVDIDYYSDSHGGISSKLGKGATGSPYACSDQLLNGHTVYSVYSFTGDNYVEIFKNIKRGNWEISSYYEWLDYTARYIWSNIMMSDRPDVIVVPESSSDLVESLAKYVSKYAKVPYLPHAFIKNPVNKITLSISENDPAYKSAKKFWIISEKSASSKLS